MSRHNPMVRVHHMLDHAREAVEMIQDRSRDDLPPLIEQLESILKAEEA